MDIAVILLHKGDNREEGPFIYRPGNINLPEITPSPEQSPQQAAREWALANGIVLPEKILVETIGYDRCVVCLLEDKLGDPTAWQSIAADNDPEELRQATHLINKLSD